MDIKGMGGLLKAAATKWTKDSAARLGAALSYYTIFAIPPLFVIIIFVASLFLDTGRVRTGLLSQVGGLIGKKGAEAIESVLSMSDPHATGLVASGLAIATLILSATGLFIELQSDLNLIWGVEAKPGQGARGFIKNRLLTFAMVVGIGFLLMVSLVLSAVLAAMGKYFNSVAPGLNVVWTVVNLLVSFGVITVLFAMVFKILPDVRIRWRDVWIGAGFTAFLFTAGKFALGLYLGKNSTVSAYGAAGSLVLVLLWVYYSGQILFFGAELTQVYANEYGARLQPKAHAQWVRQPEPQRPQAESGPAGRKMQLVSELREEVECLREQVEAEKVDDEEEWRRRKAG